MRRLLLRLGLRKTRTGRFIADTFYTPILYEYLTASITSLEELEDVILPILHPMEKSAIPLEKIEPNIRFRSWARKIFLNLKYGKTDVMRQAQMKFANLKKPVKKDTLISSFELENWEKNPKGRENNFQAQLVYQYETNDPRLSSWGLEEVLECIGCVVKGLSEFNLFCERKRIYEIYTIEYIDLLAKFIDKLASSYLKSKPPNERFTVLEAGAGNGQLSEFLRQSFIKNDLSMKKRVDVIATDSGAWGLKPLFDVERLDAIKSLEKFSPQLVIVSWMPSGVDWTWKFRKETSTHCYILIGETDDGCCGHPYLTWGVEPKNQIGWAFSKNQKVLAKRIESLDVFDWLGKQSAPENERLIEKYKVQVDEMGRNIPPYVTDGFERKNIEGLSKFQYCIYDKMTYATNSKTVVFSRKV